MNPSALDFGADGVANAYDEVLVPLMFERWANALIEEHVGWHGQSVLDLATGTGVAARLMAPRVGPSGSVIATDLNSEMLTRARQQCADIEPSIDFVESPAYPLAVSDQSIDIAVCQQAFQFFPDRVAAARELYRVLRPGGRVLVSVWCSVAECVFFGWICQVLAEIGEPEIEAMMRLPFDHLPSTHLSSPFVEAGFAEVTVERRTSDLMMPEGVSQALATAYATPIGPKLAALSEQQRDAFNDGLRREIEAGSPDGVTMGRLVAYVLKAVKPG